MMVRSIPNVLTASRLLAIPAFAWLVFRDEGPVSVPAGILFGLVALTDWLDGWLARRLNAETRFGAIADPIADRLLAAAGLLALIQLDRVHWSIPVIILGRDVWLLIGAATLTRRGYLITVDRAGKLSSLLVMVGVGLALLVESPIADAILILGLIASVLTWANYLAKSMYRRWPKATSG